jgi:hypothetical protein
MKTDLWLCACLGLRKSELLNVDLVCDRKVVRRIKIWERKNKMFANRVVPNSLATMILKHKVTYPMTL